MNFDPYSILGISKGEDKPGIRRAFRKKIKEIHPDIGGNKSAETEEITRVIQAYEFLMEQVVIFPEDSASLRPPPSFNYREFLLARSDLKSKAKLVYYDLLKNNDVEALKLYEEIQLVHRDFLRIYLENDDFLDTVFLLAVAYYQQKNWWKSLDHLVLLGEKELNQAYFKFFYIEIETRICKLLTEEVRGTWDDSEILFQIDRVLPLIIDKTESAHLWRTKAQIMWDAGQNKEAILFLKTSLNLRPRDKPGLHLLKFWQAV